MRFDRRKRGLLALSLWSLLATSHALAVQDSLPKSRLSNYAGSANTEVSGKNYGEAGVKKSSDHAPIDGKDGMPHDGPFVETSAQRERKLKSKLKNDDGDNGDDDDDDDNDNRDSGRSSSKKDSYEESLRIKDIPKNNEGVMDDKNRKAPADGTRGVEGGISKKKPANSAEKVGSKKPDPPKEQLPLPHSENLKIKGGESDDESPGLKPAETRKLLEKPTDLPDKPHSIPLPENPSSPKDHSIEHDIPPKTRNSKLKEPEEEDIIRPLHSLFLSFTMILFSEIGDKTFLVACLMAMRHDRILVFTAAFSALITMTVLSAVLGHAVPSLIPKSLTNYLAAGLFLVFGVKLLLEARKISPDEGVSEEMKEVEMELEEKENAAQRRFTRHHRTTSNLVTPYMLESGRKLPSPPSSPSSTSSSRANSPSRRGAAGTIKSALAGLNNLFSLLLSPAWVQTFVMTFLGEWGDRSQIATIAMAAGADYWWVTAGALGGHAICTGVAVIGGKAIAGRVSLRTVTMGGAFAFLAFGVIYLAEAVY